MSSKKKSLAREKRCGIGEGMACCEKCWSDAYRAMIEDSTNSQAEWYEEIKDRRTLFGPICTPKEQAGQWWNEEKQKDSRLGEDS